MNIFKIVKKELDKIFKFPRQIITSILLPGIILFVIYSFIGMGLNSMMESDEEVNSVVYVINSPDSFEKIYSISKDYKVDLINSDTNDVEKLRQDVLNGVIQAVLVYDELFDDNISKNPLPAVKILYDSSNTNAGIVMERVQILIRLQQEHIYQELGINPDVFSIQPENIAPEEKGSAMILAMILPMLLMSFIFASALSNGSDAIAGEKERGTLATLLMLPIKRSEIIIGKIISTSTLTILSAFSSFLGLVASLPFSKTMFAIEGSISYGFLEIIALVIILFLIALLASTILLIMSTLAKNQKEAASMSMPIYIAALVTPMITMFSTGGVQSKVSYLVPVYNTILGLKEILSLNFNLVNFLIILISSLVYITLIILLLVKLFKSEKVLYSK